MASFRDAQAGSGKKMKWTLHTHFEVDRSIPTKMDVIPTAGGEHDERAVMDRMVDSDRAYVMDRGYAKFELFNRIVNSGSSYVCRIRDNSVFAVLEEKPLKDADRVARVLSDQIASLGSGSSKENRNHPVRLVMIDAKRHKSRGRYRFGPTGQDCDGYLHSAANLLEVPAEIIALLYHYRWQIEIFFRSFKYLLGCRHLLSHSRNGIEVQVYCATIECMLISLWSGKKPTLRTQEMICWYFCGIADEEELLAHLAKQHKPTEPRKPLIRFHRALSCLVRPRLTLRGSKRRLPSKRHSCQSSAAVATLPTTTVRSTDAEQQQCRRVLDLTSFLPLCPASRISARWPEVNNGVLESYPPVTTTTETCGTV